METTKKTYNIELLRIVSIFIVILFHSTFSFHFKDALLECYPNYSSVMTILIWMAVCMFFLISGSIFEKQNSNNHSKDFIHFVKKKSRRLLIPYIIFTLLYCLNGGFFDLDFILKGGFWHLWFLTALFWCFIIAYALKKLNTIYVLLIALIIYGIDIPYSYDYLGVGTSFHWFIYFASGMIIERFSDFSRKMILNYHAWIVLVLLFIGCSLYSITPYQKHEYINMVGILSILIVIYIYTNEIRYSTKVSLAICRIAEKTMGIYVLHYLVMIYLLSSTSMNILGLEGLSHYAYLPIIIIIALINFVISYFITKLLKDTIIKNII